MSVECCFREDENSLGFYVTISEENLIRELLLLRQSILKVSQELKQKWCEKKMHGQFVREMPEKVDKDKSCQWLSKNDLKIGIEVLLCAAEKQAIRTNYVKQYIDQTSESLLCR